MKKALVILGPTSTGKTDLALSLAKKFNGELIACDSRQIYKGLDIGTGKLPGEKVRVSKKAGYWELDGVKQWMYDVADPKEQFTVKEYVTKALEIVEEIFKREKLPIIIGGTGLYLQALVEGLPNLEKGFNLKLRKELLGFTKEELQNKLKKLSLEKWKSLNNSDEENPRRLIRAIELLKTSDMKLSTTLSLKSLGYPLLKIGLFADREALNKRIDKRVIERIKQGMVEEAVNLYKNGLSLKRMEELGLEYRMLANLISKKIDEKQFIELLKIKIHQYAKRQMTWFKRDKEVVWFDISEKSLTEKVAKLSLAWYNNS